MDIYIRSKLLCVPAISSQTTIPDSFAIHAEHDG